MFDLKIVQNRIIYRDRGQFSPNEFRLIFHVHELVHEHPRFRETIVSIIIRPSIEFEIQQSTIQFIFKRNTNEIYHTREEYFLLPLFVLVNKEVSKTPRCVIKLNSTRTMPT